MVMSGATSTRTGARGLLALLAMLAATVAGCAAPGLSPVPATVAAAPPDRPAGRSQCPGAVPAVLTNLRGAAADALEDLQGTYEGEPGFLAVVFDGSKPVVVVEAARLPEWLLRLGPAGIAAARSCVDPDLLAAVHAVLPTVANQDGSTSAGYGGLDDTIGVSGVDAGTLVDALEAQTPGMGDRARAAIDAGTLRVDERPMSVTR